MAVPYGRLKNTLGDRYTVCLSMPPPVYRPVGMQGTTKHMVESRLIIFVSLLG